MPIWRNFRIVQLELSTIQTFGIHAAAVGDMTANLQQPPELPAPLTPLPSNLGAQHCWIVWGNKCKIPLAYLVAQKT